MQFYQSLLKNPFERKVFFILGIYILSCSVERIFTLPLAGNIIQLPELVFIFFASFILINFNKIDWKKIKLIKIDYALLIYALAVFLSWASTQKKNAFGEVLGIIYFTSFYFLTNLVFRTAFDKIKVNAQKLAFLSGIIAAAFGILGWVLLYFFNNDSMATIAPNYPILGDTIRVFGLFRGQILLADFLGISLLVTFFSKKFKWKTFSRFTWVGLGIIILGLLLTKIKSMLLLYLVLITPLLFFQKNIVSYVPRSLIKLSGWLALILYLVTSHVFFFKTNDPLFEQKFKSPYSSCIQYETPIDNLVIVPSVYSSQKALAVIAGTRHVPFGVGGNELIRYNKVLHEEGILPCSNYLTPHSTYFGAFGELGIFGFCALLFLLISIYQTILSCNFSTPQLICVMAIFLYACLQGVTTDFMNFRHYWLLLIFLGLAKRTSQQNIKLDG